jgi:HAD superfamily hydrolase (TIGR01549 family)
MTHVQDYKGKRMSGIKAVFFDVGETLINETRQWAAWAEALEVSTLTLFGVLGGCIAQGLHHRTALERIRPDYPDIAPQYFFDADDLYPDARACLHTLKNQGFFIGLAGNQPEECHALLYSLELPVDFVASSSAWGIEKPSSAFFQRICDATNLLPAQIAYVGDRLDNDIFPALELGMCAVFLKRGPWAYLQQHWDIPSSVQKIDSLLELGGVLQMINVLRDY